MTWWALLNTAVVVSAMVKHRTVPRPAVIAVCWLFWPVWAARVVFSKL